MMANEKTERLDLGWPGRMLLGRLRLGTAWGQLLLDSNNVIYNHPITPYLVVDPILIPAAEGILFNPSAAPYSLTSSDTLEVSFLVVNVDAGAAPVTVSVGIDLAAGGALAGAEYWMFNQIIAYPGSSGWNGPFVIAGDDDVRGVASVANDAAIHFRVKQTDHRT